ncbi:MAG: TonB-dependent receptor [Xanthomonadales bacterium]|nr:TonB-dependent receptor [Gammaproteobacteria bacterium]NNL05325.1 TonB-dependent receptor [Xanthomonadales bacterium]
MKKRMISRTPLSTSIAVALGAFLAQPVFGQDADTDSDTDDNEVMYMEEVMVTGVRRSLIASMDRKRSASGILDAITAEDIGKFPDTNLAEALQRIPGVSIDRFNGEGSQITVRGFGPGFNLTLLNGRQMPTAGGRSFDFLDIATEGIQAVEVYKTTRAGLPTGGIGATVNILTARPLDNPGLRAFVTAKAHHESSTSDAQDLDEWTPEVSGLYSQSFADDTFGVSVSASYSERQNREEYANVNQWFENGYTGNYNNVTDNSQRSDGREWYPQDAGYGWAENKRERTNAQIALQWAPTDTIMTTLDYTYSQTEFTKNANGFGIWFTGGTGGGANVGGAINERGVWTEVTEAGGDYATGISRDHTKKKNESLGFNVDWQATDNLTLNLDFHDSTSTLKGAGLGSLPGNTANLIIGNSFDGAWCAFDSAYPADCAAANITTKTANYFVGGIPRFDMGFQAANGGPLQEELFASDIGSLFGQAFDTFTENDVQQLQLSGSWDGDGGALQSIDFGFSRVKQDYRSQDAYSGQLPAGFWLTSAGWWDDSTFTRETFSGLLSDFNNSGAYPVDWYWTAPFDAVVDGYETVGANDPALAGCCYWPSWGEDFQDDGRGRFWPGPLTGDSVLSETITSVYMQANFSEDFNGIPVNVVAGIRYEEAKVDASGSETVPSSIVWIGGNEFIYEFQDEKRQSSGGATNEYFLPNLDVDMTFRDDLIGRFSYSRSIARPPIGLMGSTREFPGNPKVGSRFANAGNPQLEPYISDNFDLSLEWYYSEGSYVSVGYYRKLVDNFIVSSTVDATFPELGLTDPYNGPTANEARAQLVAEGITVTDPILFARINENLGNPPNTFLSNLPGDPLAAYRVSTFSNGEKGTLYGWEFQVQHLFGDTGFGVVANATIVDGDVDVDREVEGEFFALGGLSDSANLSVFYENDFISTRISYNWRDEFFNGGVNNGSPVFTEEYSQIDANLSWLINDQWTVFFEGYNLTNETQRTYARYEEMFLRGNQWGARYSIGASFRF